MTLPDFHETDRFDKYADYDAPPMREKSNHGKRQRPDKKRPNIEIKPDRESTLRRLTSDLAMFLRIVDAHPQEDQELAYKRTQEQYLQWLNESLTKGYPDIDLESDFQYLDRSKSTKQVAFLLVHTISGIRVYTSVADGDVSDTIKHQAEGRLVEQIFGHMQLWQDLRKFDGANFKSDEVLLQILPKPFEKT